MDTRKEQERAELHRTIWNIANDLRGSVDGWDFKQYVLGMLFYRYISENLTEYINRGERKATGDETFDYARLSDADAENARSGLVMEKGLFILPSQLFENVRIRAAQDENLNETLAAVFRSIEDSARGAASEESFKGLFDDIDVNSNKLGNSVANRNDRLVKLMNGVAGMGLGGYQENTIDAFGDAYEFLMGMYASNAGKSGGEYFTPQEVSELLTRIAVCGKTDVNKVYDPACGWGITGHTGGAYMKRYREYNQVDLPWLKETLSHWETKKINQLFEERVEKASDKVYPPLSVTKNGILPQMEHVAKTNAGDNRKKVLIGDFVISSRSDRKGSSGVSQHEGSVSLINTVLKIRQGVSSYWHYLLRSVLFQEEFYRNGKGIVADLWSTNYQSMKSIVVPIPPLEEQNQISNYLDWKINEIDRLIEFEKKHIEDMFLLKEKLIDEILDFKDEQRVKLKRIFDFGKGLNITKDNLGDEGTKTINYGDIHGKYLFQVSSMDCGLRRLIDNNDIVIGKFSRLKQGDFVFCDTSEDLEGCGNFSYVMDDGEELLAGYHTIVGKLKEVMNYRFIAYYMMSRHWRTQIRKSVNGIKVYSISQQILKNSTIVLPEEGTQDKIVKYLDDKIMLIQNIIKSTEDKILHLNDLKKSLISEVVTGKIDVRDIEIPEYEKVNLINEEPDDIENEEE